MELTLLFCQRLRRAIHLLRKYPQLLCRILAHTTDARLPVCTFFPFRLILFPHHPPLLESVAATSDDVTGEKVKGSDVTATLILIIYNICTCNATRILIVTCVCVGSSFPDVNAGRLFFERIQGHRYFIFKLQFNIFFVTLLMIYEAAIVYHFFAGLDVFIAARA